MEKKLKKLAAELKKGVVQPVYLLFGEDELRKRHARDRIVSVYLGEATDEFKSEYIEQATPAEVIERASMSSFFADRKVLTVGGVEKYRAEEAAQIETYLKKPSEETILVFLSQGNIDKRGKLYKTFSKYDCDYGFPYLKDKERRSRIVREMQRKNLQMDKETLQYLDFALPLDLYSIVNELEKISLFLGEKNSTDLKTIQSVIAVNRTEDIFEVVRFVGEGRGQRAIEAVDRLLTAGESELGIMALLSRQIKLFWQAKVLAAARVAPKDIASRLKVPPFFVNEYVDGGRKMEESRLAKLHSLLFDLDRRVKTGRIGPKIALEMFIAASSQK